MELQRHDGATNNARQTAPTADVREESLRRMLASRRASLVERIREGLRPGRPVGRGGNRKPDARPQLRALAIDIERELVQIATKTVRRLDAALDRLAQGRYGDCAECDEPIAVRRLELLPFTVRCVSCETKRDHALADRGGSPRIRTTSLPANVSRDVKFA